MISVLRGLFAVFFVLFHVEHHKMYPFCNYLPEVNSKFQNNLAWFNLVSLDKTTSRQ